MSEIKTKFHGSGEEELNFYLRNNSKGNIKKIKHAVRFERNPSYRFYPHFHPYVNKLTQLLQEKSIAGLQAADTEAGSGTMQNVKMFDDLFFKEKYAPSNFVDAKFPIAELDFSVTGAYSIYNWELFYHVPFAIALHLSKNQRFAEAQRWFHYLFDPTDNSDGPTPERFWKVKPFKSTSICKLEELFVNLSAKGDNDLKRDTVASIMDWMESPFKPHAIARYRQQAFMYKTVMAYLDNLIAWGDSLFLQDTGEAIDEALMLYVLAANILGPKPQPVPKKGEIRAQTFASLEEDLDVFGNAIQDLEAEIVFDLLPSSSGNASKEDDGTSSSIRNLSNPLYFCVPKNDKLMCYWDIVADRLFKIRNSLNIQGVFRQLALFESPIDPGLLASAAAAGLNVAAIVNGIHQPLPLVRFQFLLQRALEICQEVKSLGSALLAAMEKEENEALAALRAKHERVILQMVEKSKYAQWQEAIKSREGLLKSLALSAQRYVFYEKQLGKKPEEIVIPDIDALDKESLEALRFNMKEAELSMRNISVDIASNITGQAAGVLASGKILSSYEAREMLFLEAAQAFSDTANVLNTISSSSHSLPTVDANAQPMGAGVTTDYGPRDIGFALSGAARAASALAERGNFEARRAERIGSYARREQEWAFQSNLAAAEINQIYKQIRAAQIREAIAELELKNHHQQMQHAEEIEQFLNEDDNPRRGKITNRSFYTWMKREIRGLYSQCFQFAFDSAKKAERALQHELGNPELSYLQFGYLTGKEGLLAGEKLYLDLKQMEMSFHELNQREYELNKHVSLLQLDPLALIELRATGQCSVVLPEALFDIDGAGHYFRRLKTVAITIPCIVGPYTSVNCKLTLIKSSIRKTPLMDESDNYPRKNSEKDERFSDYFGNIQSIVASSGQNDSGMFDTNLRDERYLPFEGSGAISEWLIELPANPSLKDLPCQFDYTTISDVILHVRYTAREGGGLLRKSAIDNIKQMVNGSFDNGLGTSRLFSIRHEFPAAWSKFLNGLAINAEKTDKIENTDKAENADKAQNIDCYELSLDIGPDHYPYWSQGRLKKVYKIIFLARTTNTIEKLNIWKLTPKVNSNDGIKTAASILKGELAKSKYGELLTNEVEAASLPSSPIAKDGFTFYLDNKSIADLWMVVVWGDDEQVRNGNG